VLAKLRIDRLFTRLFKPSQQSPLSPIDALMGQARLGISLEEAKNTDLYKYLLARALAEHDDAVSKLLTVNPTNTKAIIRLQAEARRMEALTVWLDDAVVAGRNAELELNKQEYSDG
jgi:hypothetical protein